MQKSLFKYFMVLAFIGVLSCKTEPKNEKEVPSKTETIISNDEKEEVINDAKEWLNLIYESNYSQSWDNTASLLQNAVTKEQWTQQLESIVPPLGKVVSREMISAEYYTELPGAPDGEYLVIQFKTSFENKNEGIETVTPMKEGNNWKVSGYYIK